MKDFNIKLTVRSARVLAAIEDKFGSQSEMSRATGISLTKINGFATMRHVPVGLSGWTKTAETFASALGEYPSDLWPEHMRDVKLKRATADVSLDLDDVRALTTSRDLDLKYLLSKSARGVKDRQLRALMMQMDGATLDEIGGELGVTRERARQITIKSLRVMKGNLARMGIRSVTDALT